MAGLERPPLHEVCPTYDGHVAGRVDQRRADPMAPDDDRAGPGRQLAVEGELAVGEELVGRRLDVFDLLHSPETLRSLVLVGNMRHHLEVVPNEEVGDQLAVDVHRSLRPAQRDRENVARRSDAHCASRAGY